MFGCRFTMRSRIIISNFLVLLLISSPTTGLQAAQTERLMIVTGASAGIGEAIVKKFSKDGWKVAALARNKDKLLSVAKDAGDRCVPIVCDVSIPQSVIDAVDKACEITGCEPNVLINNAALYENRPFAEFSLSDIDSLIDVNLKGSMYVTRTVLPRMLSSGGGRIIFVNSVAGLPTWTIPGETVYSATKHGLSGFADSLANEVRTQGVLVTSIHPGGVDTPLQETAGAPKDVRDLFLRPGDIASCVEHIVESPPHVLYKRLEVFSNAYWH
mmetsp:Transcript_68844/g.155716  ORF Transcript_68844/g.155716 Transcript_68844/m.155716 type:complete len:271 (-) Transcript_68844:277-1089(-)